MTNVSLIQVKDLHTYFYTDEGIVKAVDGIDFLLKKNSSFHPFRRG